MVRPRYKKKTVYIKQQFKKTLYIATKWTHTNINIKAKQKVYHVKA